MRKMGFLLLPSMDFLWIYPFSLPGFFDFVLSLLDIGIGSCVPVFGELMGLF